MADKRSTGQCRVGVDAVDYYSMPTHICSLEQGAIGAGNFFIFKTTIIECASTQDHGHDEDCWTCFEMRGELRFWFSCEETDIKVVVHGQY